MTVYQSDYVGKNEKQFTLYDITVDGNTTLSSVGFDEAMGYVNDHIQFGDTYLESEYGEIYATFDADEFISVLRPII